MPGAVKNLLAFFQEYFADYFDVNSDSQETEEAKSKGGVSISLPLKLMMPSKQPLLSAVEYQALFVAFLSLHSHL